MSGAGCPRCSGRGKSNTSIFIEDAINIHGDCYDYGKVEYKKSSQKIIIICKKHNIEFSQTPNSHLSGRGCPECGVVKHSNTKDFIEKAKLIYGDKYNYIKVEYINAYTKVIIICKKHNKEFSQTPTNHLFFNGCPKCLKTHKQNKWLDSIGVPDDFEHRNIAFRIDKKLFKPDGFDSNTKTIYEFYGDSWHGNPIFYKSEDINPVNKKTYGELYRATIERENTLKQNGYTIVSIWESDFDKLI